MATILGLDSGTVKSLAFLYDPGNAPAHFAIVHTDPAELRKLLEAEPARACALVTFDL
jgi:hypothetical protein